MTLKLENYINTQIDVQENTVGGSTYTVRGKAVCFAYLRSHYRAVRALTDGHSKNYQDIKDSLVNELIDYGDVKVDASDCLDEYGWLGCKVWDGDDVFIGTLGNRCNNAAGWGTEHVGTGRCKLHGGAKIYRSMLSRFKHGLSSKFIRARVTSKIGKYLSDPAPLDLSKELATQRALLDELMGYVVDRGDTEHFSEQIPVLMRLSDMIGRQVERIVSIEQKYALTASQVLYVQAVVVDILNKYLETPAQKDKAARELAERLGTGDRPIMVIAPQILERAGF